MCPKKFYGMTLAEILFSMGISAFIMYAILGLLSNTILHERIYIDAFDELQKKSRILSIIESRVVNAGLGVPSAENVEDIFRFPVSGKSVLPGWRNVLEILTNKDIPVNFQDVDGEQVARGERLRVLSTHHTSALDMRILPPGGEWGPYGVRSADISKIKNRFVSYEFRNGELSSWITTLSLSRPVIIKSINTPGGSSTGRVELQNPLLISMDWYGIDMFHSFRIAYFHVEAETIYIRDSTSKDTTNAFPSKPLDKQPVVDGVLSVCFELNKTAKTLQCWFLIRGSGLSVKNGIPPEWPVWAKNPPAVYSNKLKVITHSWHLKNI